MREKHVERRMPRWPQVLVALLLLGALGCARAAPAPEPAAPAPAPAAAAPQPAQPPEAKATAPAPAAAATPAPATVAAPVAKARSEPRYGGKVDTYADARPTSYDLHLESSIRTTVPFTGSFNGILTFAHDDPDKIEGDLARSWTVSQDLKTFTFKFHEGVKFTDGSEFTAADAKASLERIMTHPRSRTYRDWFADFITTMETPDRYTLVIKTKLPDPTMTSKLAAGGTVMYSKAALDKGWDPRIDLPIGTGPFIMKRIVPGSTYFTEKNPNYFKKGLPYLDGRTYFIMEQELQLVSLITGKIDWSGPASKAVDTLSEQKQILARVPNMVIQPYQAFSGFRVQYNVKRAPFSDVRVRKALDLAIDRHLDNQINHEGAGYLAGWVPGKSGLPGILEKPEFKPMTPARLQEAKQLLAQAGYPQGFKLTISISELTHWVKESAFIKDQWKAIGVEATIDIKDAATNSERIERGNYDLTVTSIAERFPEPSFWLEKYTDSPSKNTSGYANPKFDQFYEQLLLELDEGKRVELARQMQQIIYDDRVDSILAYRPSVYAWWPYVKNFAPGYSHYHRYTTLETVWIDKSQ